MLPELERLIRLQQLDNTAAAARRTVNAIPVRIADLDARLAARRGAVDDATGDFDRTRTERQAVEKSLAEVQSRLSRYKDQLMAVKTNKEYTAMQHEIATAEAEVQRLEDANLEQMLRADDLTARVAETERALKTEEAEVGATRAALESERAEMERRLEATSGERAKVADSLADAARRLFETIAGQRGGLAVVEARDGHCSVCNVRLRPQMFNQILRNSALIQCESCMRVLYYAGGGSQTTATSDSAVTS